MVSGSISLPSSGFFSPFPHGTRSLSVSQEYLALPDGPGRFAQDSSCPALLRIPLGRLSLRVRVCHPLRTHFPECSAHDQRATAWSYNPRYASPHTGFGLFPVRSPLLRESLLFSLPAATKMFQFAAFAHLNRCDGSSIRRVAPFGDLRIKGHLHLPGAFRSLSRPSSPSRAKASACCPFLLLLCLVPVLIPSGTRPVLLKVILRLSFYFLRSHATKACSLRLYYYLKLLNNVKDRFLKAREACSDCGE